MKKLLNVLILMLISSSVVFGDDFFDNYIDADRSYDAQKSVTNKEFEEAINTLQAGQKKKEEKQKKKKIKKISGGGTSLHEGLDPMQEIQAQDMLKEEKDDVRLLNIPVNFVLNNNILEKGYYNVVGTKEKDGKVYLNFYQAHDLKGRIKAKQTQNDYESDAIDFVKMTPYNEQYLKIMYGSLDFNAYTFVEYENE